MAWFLGLFAKDKIKTTILIIVVAVVVLLILSSVAYASYSWAKRGEAERIEDVKTAMREQFDKERENLIKTYQRSDEYDRRLTEIKTAIEKQGGEIGGKLSLLRRQYKDIYDIMIPKEGVEQWEASRNLYNSAARPPQQ